MGRLQHLLGRLQTDADSAQTSVDGQRRVGYSALPLIRTNSPMRPGFHRLATAAFVMAASSAVAMATPASPFDGSWTVTLTCPASTDGRALGYSYEFPVRVKDNILEGEHGTQGEPGWLKLSGPIQPDGSAALLAEGLTNLPNYALYSLKRGTPYKHAVTAKFDPHHGSGSWITIRTCTFDFARP